MTTQRYVPAAALGSLVTFAVLGLGSGECAAQQAQADTMQLHGTQFQEVGREAGVRFIQRYEPVVPYGGGAGWADFDGDGDLDLVTTQTAGCNLLHLNAGDGTFEPFDDDALAACDLRTRGTAIADYDNDGDRDVYLTAFGGNRLLENQLVPSGTLAFVDVTTAAGMSPDGGGNSGSAAWGDYDRDGYLDLFVTNHTFLIPPPTCERDILWHNEGDGTFTNVANELGIATGGDVGMPGCGLAATWSDYDEDGDLDLMVVNDFGASFTSNRLFRNDGPHPFLPWTFTDVSRESRFDYDMFGMGIAKGDLDRDGDLDYYMADIGANNLAINRGDGTFVESAAQARVLASDVQDYHGSGLVSWAVGFFDLNHDGWEDLVVTNGGAPDEAFPGVFGQSYVDRNPNYLYQNDRDGTFSERHEGAGLVHNGYHRSLAVADYDDDGDLDLYFGTMSGANALYRNDQSLGGHWLKVKLEGTVGNRDAYGARVRIRSGTGLQQREIDGGSGFLARHDPTAHFGLASETVVDVLEVRFLSGLELSLRDVAVDQTLELAEPTATLTLVEQTGDEIVVRIEPHRPHDRVLEIWLEPARPDAAPDLLHHSITDTVDLVSRIWLPPGSGAAGFRLRLGHYPDEVIHQIYVDTAQEKRAGPPTDR